MGEVAADLISRARAGDGDAFRELTEPYLRELQVHCYRMLGSFQDAEDALQNTLLTAWQGLGGFEGRASLRTWLYRIATNRCLDARRAASRRPAKEWDIPGVESPEPTRRGEVVWLQPFPDAILEGGIEVPLGPEARYEQTEVHLAGLRDRPAGPAAPPARRAHLARRPRIPRQRGGRHAGLRPSNRSTAPSSGPAPACSASSRRPRGREPPPAAGSPAEDALVAKFVRACESADLDALVALLTDDVFMSMPPMPFEYEGRDVVARFCPSLFGAGRKSTSCRREPTASRRSGPTCAPIAASATGPASSS